MNEGVNGRGSEEVNVGGSGPHSRRLYVCNSRALEIGTGCVLLSSHG